MMEINYEELQKWIEALDSGKYKQGEKALHIINENGYHSYCCLGVACKVLIPEDKLLLNRDGCRIYGAFPGAQNNAPHWLKVINENFQLRTGFKLSWLNDGFFVEGLPKFTFPEIATLLELVYIHKILDDEN